VMITVSPRMSDLYGSGAGDRFEYTVDGKVQLAS
jgi:hypothetical protein